MAKGPQYNLPFRRRREARTSYRKRRRLVSSASPRFVVRPSNKHLLAQIIRATPKGDRVLVSAHSSELKELGWRGPCGNLPAAYLTGLLAGKRAKTGGVEEAILDIGLHSRGAGTRIFAATKGAIEAGLTIPHDEAVLPKKDRIQGKHIADYSKALSSNVETHKKRFSRYLKEKFNPQEIPDQIIAVENKIKGSVTEEAS